MSNLVEGQIMFWVRAGTPTDDEAQLVPDFATISIEYIEKCKWPIVPNTPQTVAVSVDSTQFVVAGLRGRALNSNGRFQLVKMRKIFVDAELYENDEPNVRVVKQGGPKCSPPKGISLGMTWVLCQFWYKDDEQDSPVRFVRKTTMYEAESVRDNGLTVGDLMISVVCRKYFCGSLGPWDNCGIIRHRILPKSIVSHVVWRNIC